ncbi:MAG: hypothetical protein U5L96_04550 [Owenweeksia sp.]|nr:hypothetical protein [Owenweeksia sp.]
MAALTANKWALILGGSSGMGLASAHKLSQEGYNLSSWHRDRKSGAQKAEEEFEKMREKGVICISFNVDALNEESKQPCWMTWQKEWAIKKWAFCFIL